MDSEIDNLLAWARKKGIDLNGCAPKQLHGRGVGIVATRPVKVSQPNTSHLSSAAPSI